YTPGRNGSIKAVTIHHMGGNLSIDGCYSTWQTREASAHYAVQADGTIGQLVNDWDTAWACANAWANSNTISIEHANNQFGPWTVNDTVLDQGAHLVAAICRKYGLGRPEWLVNVFPHSHWSATDCPGELQRSQNAEYMARAQAWYDEMGGGAAPSPAPSPAPSVGIPDLRYRVRTANGVLPE
ncbi:N-acetylmuramoyl-L-alanine amidase, partial [Eggerthella lenta]|uniref:peptidoglycan recognition protein family protein n=4 Tax=Eggerthellaceae TaxID=1643826 RepID=UPI001F43053D